MAQFTFCGRMAGPFMSGMMAALELTTPTTDPSAATTGPPRLPGWTGTVIWRNAVSVSGPDTASTEPSATFDATPGVPAAGKPTLKIASPSWTDRASRMLSYVAAAREGLSTARSRAAARSLSDADAG